MILVKMLVLIKKTIARYFVGREVRQNCDIYPRALSAPCTATTLRVHGGIYSPCGILRGMIPPPSYRRRPNVPDAVASELASHVPLMQQLLWNRGIETASDADAFLAPLYETLHDPFLMTDMLRAVECIERAIKENEHIVVYSDYDCDGIPGGVLLHDFFRAIRYDNFENYIPHRHHEGYGLSIEALDTLHARGAQIIITVDCGITDVEPVAHANSLGMEVIVTDHHELGQTLPDAYAVLNPKRDDAYPFKGLCGTGVAWKLVEALLSHGDYDLKEGQEKWWLDVVGLATIADMVPLVGENRVLAHYGLTVLRKTRRPGLQHLMRAMRLSPRTLTEDDIGFMIGPRINAASRMDTPEDAFNMLATQEEEAAGGHARHLEMLNNERKGVVAAMVKDIKKRMKQMTEVRSVIVMGNPEWRPALVGLAANTLAETYQRPVFLWGRDGRDVIKGSCRAGGGVSVVSLMHEVKDVLIEYGGHHASGGFSVQQEHMHTFDDRLNDAFAVVSAGVDTAPREYFIDGVLTVAEVTSELVRNLNTLAPFGEANAKPLFAFANVVPQSVTQFGKGKDHTKLVLAHPRGTLEAIAFFSLPDSFTTPLSTEVPVTLIAHVEQSFFMNRLSIRLRIVDVLPADADVC